MNKKDKEAFEEWRNSPVVFDIYDSWQAACEYKDKQYLNGTVLKTLNEKYENEVERSKILVEALELMVGNQEFYCGMGDYNKQSLARVALAKYRGEK